MQELYTKKCNTLPREIKDINKWNGMLYSWD